MEEYEPLWAIVQTCIPGPKVQAGPGGRPRRPDKEIFYGIMHVMRSGCRWKDMPRVYGTPATAHRRFQEWTEAKVFQKAYSKLLEIGKSTGEISLSEGFIDGTFSPAKKGR